jgi:dipeptidyl aminopeptidase/acylaminoacyl peptidase
LTSFGGAYTASPYWSPDGRWIAFDSTSGGRIAVYIVPADGGAPKRLTAGTVDTGVGAWSRDGRWVYVYSGGQVWKVPSHGGAPVPFTKHGGAHAKESPDGRFLYYLKSDAPVASLWKIPAVGGEEKQVLPAVCCAGFDVAANGIYFIRGDGEAIQFLNFRDNGITTLVPIKQEGPAYGLSLAPDGGSLLYSLFEASNSDLMMVENVP